jgi:hypothetical protein
VRLHGLTAGKAVHLGGPGKRHRPRRGVVLDQRRALGVVVVDLADLIFGFRTPRPT